MRILYFGTPDFACRTLEMIYAAGHMVCGVVTQPDKPKNRGMQLTAPPVKTLALAHGTPVHQPTTLRDEAALRLVQELAPDLIVVVAYGKILPRVILDVPTYGGINLHPSLLPKYQGATPIQQAILNGDRVTGVSVMVLDDALDQGDVLAQEETEILPYETSGQLFERLALQGARLLVDTIPAIFSGTVQPIAQDPLLATYAKPLSREMSPVDWGLSARSIVNQICGLNPWPMATAVFGGKLFKIHAAQVGQGELNAPPGTILSAGNAGLEVAAGAGSVIITTLQPPGKKPMAAGDYLRGNPIE